MESFIAIVVIVVALLQIVLFFKLWGMTNNVSSILNVIRERSISNPVKPAQQQSSQQHLNQSSSTEVNTDSEEIKYNIGEKVLFFGKELIITGDNGDGTYNCSDTDGRPYSTTMMWQKIKRKN